MTYGKFHSNTVRQFSLYALQMSRQFQVYLLAKFKNESMKKLSPRAEFVRFGFPIIVCAYERITTTFQVNIYSLPHCVQL